MAVGAPTAKFLAVAMIFLSTARAFVRPVFPAALSSTHLSKLSGSSQQTRAKSAGPTKMGLESQGDKLMYAFGAALASQTSQFKKLLSAEEREVAMQGFGDAWLDKEMKLDPGAYADEVNSVLDSRNKEMEKSMEEKGKGFLDEAAKEEGAVQTASGLVVKSMIEGTGAAPKETDTVNVHYHGTLVDGSTFDSSVLRGSPISFPLNGVIKGWSEGLLLMKVGGKSKLTIPPELAYGPNGTGPIPPNATLTFVVDLLAIE